MRQVNHAKSFSHVVPVQHNGSVLALQLRIDVGVALDALEVGKAGTGAGTDVPLPMVKVNGATSSAPVMTVKVVTGALPATTTNKAAMAQVAPQISAIPTSSSAETVNPSVSSVPLKVPVSAPAVVGNAVAKSVANAVPTDTSTAEPLGSDPRRPADLQEVVDAIYSLDRGMYAHLFADPQVDIEATANNFFAYYESKDWKIGDAPIRNWLVALRRAIDPSYTVDGKRRGWAIIC